MPSYHSDMIEFNFVLYTLTKYVIYLLSFLIMADKNPEKDTEKSDTHTSITCGWCGKQHLNKSATCEGTSYIKKCACCGTLSYNAKKCATIFLKQQKKTDIDSNEVVSIDAFNKCTLLYNCSKCQQKKCFICKKSHTQRKYLFIIFIRYLYIISTI